MMGEKDDKGLRFREEVDAMVRRLAEGDDHEYIRRWKQLATWGQAVARGNPARKAGLKKKLTRESHGRCKDCNEEFKATELEMHRRDTSYAFDRTMWNGYFADNIDLLCASCHDKREDERRS